MIATRLLSHIRRQPIALLALFVALGGSSYAAVSSGAKSSDEVIHACVGENSGRLRVVDSALFSLLGTSFGGDGVTTFRVPDLRKQAPVGTHYTLCHTGIYPSHP